MLRCSVCREIFPEFIKKPPRRMRRGEAALQRRLHQKYACDFHVPFPLKRPKGLSFRSSRNKNAPARVISLRELKPEGTHAHTYTRSDKSKNHGPEFIPYKPSDPPLTWNKTAKQFERQRPTPANVSGFKNFLETLDVPDDLPRQTRESWSADSLLYDSILRHENRNVRFLAKELSHPSVYVANDYPCLHIDVGRLIQGKIQDETYINRFVEYAASILNGYLDFFAFKAGFFMPCVVRSSFGFLTPTTAETRSSIRLSLGIAPTGYLNCVLDALRRFLKDLQVFITQGLKEPVDVPFFRSTPYVDYRNLTQAPFKANSTVQDYLTQKADKKKGLLEDAQRTFSGSSLATRKGYEALAEGGNGIIRAVKAVLDDSLWSVTGTAKKPTLSFNASGGLERYALDLESLEAPCEYASHDDSDFLELTNLLLQRTRTLYDPMEDDQFSRWKAAVFATEKAVLEGVGTLRMVEDDDDGAGSDSDEEFEVPTSQPNTVRKMLHQKLIVQNGMNAISIAMHCARFWLQDVWAQEIHVIDKLPLDKLQSVTIGGKAYDVKSLGAAKHKFVPNPGKQVDYVNPTKRKLTMDTGDVLLLTQNASVKHTALLESRADLVSVYLEQMYFEAPHLLDIHRWTKRTKTLSGAQVVLMDVNHCETGRPSGVADTLFDLRTVPTRSLDLASHRVVVLDVTSATTEQMNRLIRQFVRGADPKALLMLVDSGLKHQQLGSDRNAYGTVRFISNLNRRKQVESLQEEAKKLPAYQPQGALSHSVRRGFKALGATPSFQSIWRPKTNRDALLKVPSPFKPSDARPTPRDVEGLADILALAVSLKSTAKATKPPVMPAHVTSGSFSQFDIPGAGSACSPICILAMAKLLHAPDALDMDGVNDVVIQGAALYQGIVAGIEGARYFATHVQSLKGEKILEGIHLNPYETPDAILNDLGLAWGGQQTCGRLSLASTLFNLFSKSNAPQGLAIVIGGYTVSVTRVGGVFCLFDSHGFGNIQGAFLEKHANLSTLLRRLGEMIEARLPRGESLSLSRFTPT
ncbi:hypothetical protein [Corallococcus aberystwythensis]|uniref:Uncharacterized protein n=1 Tax=Corallococcus aberystwythensis TaxID=2316722 RepID=A0A3A8R6R9_9BACT|nr:hypothetical protein [Corallococcus aberystwythensis]RKH72942.1 hypothetical protein D7W81_04965 [Corallococcus aberystwythensis]